MLFNATRKHSAGQFAPPEPVLGRRDASRRRGGGRGTGLDGRDIALREDRGGQAGVGQTHRDERDEENGRRAHGIEQDDTTPRLAQSSPRFSGGD